MTGNSVLIATRTPCPSLLLHVNAAFPSAVSENSPLLLRHETYKLIKTFTRSPAGQMQASCTESVE